MRTSAFPGFSSKKPRAEKPPKKRLIIENDGLSLLENLHDAYDAYGNEYDDVVGQSWKSSVIRFCDCADLARGRIYHGSSDQPRCCGRGRGGIFISIRRVWTSASYSVRRPLAHFI